jgi:hypothetical protein
MLETLFGKMHASVPGAPLAELRAYWEGLRVNGAIPTRAVLDPRGIAGALEVAFVAERVAPGQARFRIAGMQIAEMLGMEARGLPLMTLVAPQDRAAFAAALEQVFAGPAMVEMWLEAERGPGRPALEGRLLILPLAEDHGHVTRAIGVLATAGTIGRSPRRFALARRTVTRILTPAPASAEPAFAETPAVFEPPPRAVPGRAHLRLVRSD